VAQCKKSSWGTRLRAAVCVAALSALAACDGGALLIGTVASDAPMPNASMAFKCSSTSGDIVSGTALANASGGFILPIQGAQAPCLLQVTYTNASGLPVSITGFAAADGVANVTPLTHAALASALNVSDVNAVFAALDATAIDTLKSTDFNAAWAALRSKLTALGVDTSRLGSPFTDSFKADGSAPSPAYADVLLALAARGLAPEPLIKLAKGQNVLPTVQLNLPNGPALTGAPLAFSATGTMDPDGQIASYSWDFGDDSPVQTGATLSAPSHAYSSAGSKTVRLVVTDNQGATSSATATINVSDVAPANSAPVAALALGNNAPDVNQPVHFSPTLSTDTDGRIVSYTWSFGDGIVVSTSTPEVQAHTYVSSGVKTVQLTVTDEGGATSTVTQSITVTAAAPADLGTLPKVDVAAPTATAYASPGVVLAPQLQLASPTPTLLGAKVQIVGGLKPFEDSLTVNALAGVTTGYDAATGTLSLVGEATVAQYTALLQSVRYVNSGSSQPAATGANGLTTTGLSTATATTRQILFNVTNAAGESADTTAARASVDLAAACTASTTPNISVVVNEAYGEDGAQMVPFNTATTSCKDITNEGCRLLLDLSGNEGVQTFKAQVAATTCQPAGAAAPTYHWEIFFPVSSGGAKYTSAGMVGYYSPELTIEPGSLPDLGAGLWRVELTVTTPTVNGVPGQTVVKRFRFGYQSSPLTVEMSTNCQSPLPELNSQCSIRAGLPVAAGIPT
jgi:PKD repeat protein